MWPRKLVHYFKGNDQQKANHVASSLVTSSSTLQYTDSQLVDLKVKCARNLERRSAIDDITNEHVLLQCVAVQHTIKINHHSFYCDALNMQKL